MITSHFGVRSDHFAARDSPERVIAALHAIASAR